MGRAPVVRPSEERRDEIPQIPKQKSVSPRSLSLVNRTGRQATDMQGDQGGRAPGLG